MGARVRVARFRPQDQQSARALILHGLGEHFGEVKAHLNPDLDDIADTFSSGCFVVAWDQDTLVGTGGFLPVSDDTIQVHRMSVATERRRDGIGSMILGSLLDAARERGFSRAMLETTETWREVIAFWERNGFRHFDRRDGDVYLEHDLSGVG